MKKSFLHCMCALLGVASIGESMAQAPVPPNRPKHLDPNYVDITPAMVEKAKNTPFKWYNKLEEAQKVSKETGLPILVLFTGKWCGMCKQFESKVLKKGAFVKDMKGVAIGVKVHFNSREAMKRNELVKKYAVHGTPKIIIVDGDGIKQASCGYVQTKSAKGYVEYFKSFNSHSYVK